MQSTQDPPRVKQFLYSFSMFIDCLHSVLPIGFIFFLTT